MIKKNSVVSLHYKMYDENNELIDETSHPIEYLHGGYDGIFPLVEEALHEKNVGDTVEVLLQPEDAFGEQDPQLVRIEDVKVFPVDVADGKAVVDGNHPLAGLPIRFTAKVDGVRDATEEEIAHGHVHGAHGHHH